jgi:hypothetical protein
VDEPAASVSNDDDCESCADDDEGIALTRVVAIATIGVHDDNVICGHVNDAVATDGVPQR